MVNGTTCTGLSDTTAGNVTVTVAYLTRFLLPATSVRGAVIFTITEVHWTCGTQLMRMRGLGAGEVTSTLNTPQTSSVVTVATNKKGDDSIIEVDNEAQTGMEHAELLQSVGTGAVTLTEGETDTDAQRLHADHWRRSDGVVAGNAFDPGALAARRQRAGASGSRGRASDLGAARTGRLARRETYDRSA
jgi:hypothetical protein